MGIISMKKTTTSFKNVHIQQGAKEYANIGGTIACYEFSINGEIIGRESI